MNDLLLVYNSKNKINTSYTFSRIKNKFICISLSTKLYKYALVYIAYWLCILVRTISYFLNEICSAELTDPSCQNNIDANVPLGISFSQPLQVIVYLCNQVEYIGSGGAYHVSTWYTVHELYLLTCAPQPRPSKNLNLWDVLSKNLTLPGGFMGYQIPTNNNNNKPRKNLYNKVLKNYFLVVWSLKSIFKI